jgi:hypothetical protein
VGAAKGRQGLFLRPGFRARVRVPVGFCAGRNRVLTFGQALVILRSVPRVLVSHPMQMAKMILLVLGWEYCELVVSS